ncbi:MAG: homoserine dehydrogenase [Deltaproteobacteria bacterium]|jgi:homoserine dehydrogenase|nr:homoserine dehydrogenase [Deltaproteobacteria bacterium]
MQTNVGLLGYGTVGAGVAKIISLEDSLLSQKVGWPLKLARAVVRDLSGRRSFPAPPGLLTTDPSEVVGNPGIQVVVEVMGGLEPARTLVLRALEAGQHVVTANKALLAVHGREIFETAAQSRREVAFEAAVAGAIPVIRTLKEGLAANRIQSVAGILNGTTNYILTKMSRGGAGFAATLKEAQELGFAEADPTTDVEGTDAAHKLILLTALAYGVLPTLDDIHAEGITGLEPEDFSFAEALGYVIKLLAQASLNSGDGRLEVRLHPTMIPRGHLLAGVSGAMNAVMIRGHASGDIFLSGAGAGMMPTASAVVGDIVEIARLARSESGLSKPSLGWHSLKAETVKPASEIWSRYYLRFSVLDRPGVLASLAGILARHDVSIAQMIQKGPDAAAAGESVRLVMLTHSAPAKSIRAALGETGGKEWCRGPARLLRVEDFAQG